MKQTDIGVYGLGVMGKNLALNFEDHGFSVSVYNRKAPGEEKIVDNFISQEGKGKAFFGAGSVKEFCRSITKPRKILIMVKAGPPVDHVIKELHPFLEPEDILIDGGNSHFEDTERRTLKLADKNIHFVGMGVSGGEEGARNGPSLMPGGNKKAWPDIKPLLEPISAAAFDGSPCCAWIGKAGAGHFVKMVHNGIEYADMQIISEAYHVMKSGLELSTTEISNQFRQWADSSLSSYLFEITAEILTVTDTDGQPLVDKILDRAGQKGTGKWTAIHALEMGIPLPCISQAVFSRYFSSLKNLRVKLSEKIEPPSPLNSLHKKETLADLEQALVASRMISHAEGFYLISSASNKFGWDINMSAVAKIWQGGCIIRSELLNEIFEAYSNNPDLQHLMLDNYYSEKIYKLQSGWRNFLSKTVKLGIPAPSMLACLNEYDSLRSEQLPANIIQAQRDYFGAHTYERTDKPEGTFFHTDWQNTSKC